MTDDRDRQSTPSESRIILDTFKGQLDSHAKVEADHHDDHEDRLKELEKWHVETLATSKYESLSRKRREASLDMSLKLLSAVPALVSLGALMWWAIHQAMMATPPPIAH